MKPTSVALGCIVLLASTSFAQRFTLDEKETIYKTLEFARGSKPKTAELLKLSLKTIYNKIKEYGLEH